MTRMRILSAIILACVALCAPAAGATDDAIARLVTCQDSWLDWQKPDDPRLKQLAARLQSAYERHGNDAFLVPKSSTSVAGFRVLQLYPDSLGMGVGISVLLDAPFDAVRKSLERTLGKPLVHCETGDGMQTCELPVAEKRTVTLMMQDDPKSRSTLLGCYYYYER